MYEALLVVLDGGCVRFASSKWNAFAWIQCQTFWFNAKTPIDLLKRGSFQLHLHTSNTIRIVTWNRVHNYHCQRSCSSGDHQSSFIAALWFLVHFQFTLWSVKPQSKRKKNANEPKSITKHFVWNRHWHFRAHQMHFNEQLTFSSPKKFH